MEKNTQCKKFMLNFLPDFLRMMKWKLKSSKKNVEFFMRIFHEHKIKEQLKIFCSHRKKRMKQLQKKIKRGKLDMKEDDPFELFVAATSIRYCYYAETHKILGQTFGMCILQVIEFLVHFTLKGPCVLEKLVLLFYIRKIKILRNTSTG